jgi:hypothetical protein
MSEKPETKVVSLRLPVKLIEKLDKQAAEEHRLRGNMLAVIVERYFLKEKP